MNEAKAKAILSDALPNDLYIEGFNQKIGNVYLFFVKEKKYKNDDYVLPENYGIKENGDVLNMDGVTNYLREIGID